MLIKRLTFNLDIMEQSCMFYTCFVFFPSCVAFEAIGNSLLAYPFQQASFLCLQKVNANVSLVGWTKFVHFCGGIGLKFHS